MIVQILKEVLLFFIFTPENIPYRLHKNTQERSIKVSEEPPGKVLLMFLCNLQGTLHKIYTETTRERYPDVVI